MDIFVLVSTGISLLVGLLPFTQGQPPIYTIELESGLRKELFSQYDTAQRPAQRVYVNVGMSVLTINEMNVKDQILSMSLFFDMSWTDLRLKWTPPHNLSQDYSSIFFMFSSELQAWRPTVLVDNSVDSLEIMSDKNILMRLTQMGRITWNPAGIYRVSCDADISYYPFDTQVCYLSLSAWSYTITEVDLMLPVLQDAISLSFFVENGEWELIKSYAEKVTDGISVGLQSFSNIKYYLVLRRRPMFHLLNTILPVVLMAVLSSMVFRLPADSGEKVGFSLTVLLAYAVYLSLISEDIPSTSLKTCYLSIYLVFILSLSTLAVLLTIFVLEVNFKSNEENPMSPRQKTFCRLLMVITFWYGFRSCCKKRTVKPSDEPEKLFAVKTENKQTQQQLRDKKDAKDEDLEPTETKVEEEIDWQLFSKVLDKLCFLMFFMFIIVSTLLLLGTLIHKYRNY